MLVCTRLHRFTSIPVDLFQSIQPWKPRADTLTNLIKLVSLLIPNSISMSNWINLILKPHSTFVYKILSILMNKIYLIFLIESRMPLRWAFVPRISLKTHTHIPEIDLQIEIKLTIISTKTAIHPNLIARKHSPKARIANQTERSFVSQFVQC